MFADFQLTDFDRALMARGIQPWPENSVSDPNRSNGFYFDDNNSGNAATAYGLTTRGNKTGLYLRDLLAAYIYDCRAFDFDPARVHPDAKDFASGFKIDNTPLIYAAGLLARGKLSHRGDLNSEVFMEEGMNDASIPSTCFMRDSDLRDGGETIIDAKSWYFYGSGLHLEGAMETFKGWRLRVGALAHSTLVLRPGEGRRFLRLPIGGKFYFHESVRCVWDGGEKMGAPPADMVSGSDYEVIEVGQMPDMLAGEFFTRPEPAAPPEPVIDLDAVRAEIVELRAAMLEGDAAAMAEIDDLRNRISEAVA